MRAVMTADVNWNPNEKIIGVVGVAPAATADFYHKIIKLTPVKKDWEHVRVLIDSNPKIPSRGRYLELQETDPVPYIQDCIQQLSSMGASIIAIPCNTAHILYERYTQQSSVIIPNMIQVTVATAAKRLKRAPSSAAVFASRMTKEHQLYDVMLKKMNGSSIETSTHQTAISNLIEEVKQGKDLEPLRIEFHDILAQYPQADCIILGCTELSLLLHNEYAGIPVIDSNMALAEACLLLSENHAFTKHYLR